MADAVIKITTVEAPIEQRTVEVDLVGPGAAAAIGAAAQAEAARDEAQQAVADAEAIAAGIPQFTELNTPDYLEPIIDGYDHIAGGWKPDGSFDAARLTAEEVEADRLISGAAEFNAEGVSDYAESVRDGNGNIAGGWRSDGTFAAAAADFEQINGVPIATVLAGGSGGGATANPSFRSKIAGVASYGQSLSVGIHATPALSTTQPYDSLMFNVGIRTVGAGTPTSLVPLVEATSGDGSAGETPVAGAVARIKMEVAARHQIAVGDYPYQLLGSAPGVPATTIGALSSPFTGLANDITNGKALANAAGKSYSFEVWHWTQGSSDYSAGTSKATYKAALLQLNTDIIASAKSITKQDFNPQGICGQSTDHYVYGFTQNPYIGIAQLEVSKEVDDFHIACPMYIFPNSDDPHLTNAGSLWYAHYLGLCHYRTVIAQEEWQPLDCIAAYAQSTSGVHIVRAKFHVPVGKLVWDATISAAVINRGFTVYNSLGVGCDFLSIEIVAPDEVEFVVNATAVGGKLTNGRNVRGACALRDEQGDSLALVPGINKPLHNHCVLFEKAL
jgi:hypothetical protein